MAKHTTHKNDRAFSSKANMRKAEDARRAQIQRTMPPVRKAYAGLVVK